MHDTIVAFAGGSLPAAVGLVRLSGPRAHAVLEALFRPRGIPAAAMEDRRLYHGRLVDAGGATLDFPLACRFGGPRSYTGEDMAELYCHGGPAVVAEALRAACALGARPAEPGEFTRRAFLAGKLDLTAAEAVADLIDAASPLAAREAAAQLGGTVRSAIAGLREALTGLLAHFYAACDYTDEDIEPFEREQAALSLTEAAERLARLHRGFEQGRLLGRGIPVALVGRPNAGKSSLFNALAGHERAIVTDQPGTTRDVLDVQISCGGAPIRLLDTAGLRPARGKAEQMGVGRALEALDESRAALMVVDCAAPATRADADALRRGLDKGRRLLVLTQADRASDPARAARARLGELRALGLADLLPPPESDAPWAAAAAQGVAAAPGFGTGRGAAAQPLPKEGRAAPAELNGRHTGPGVPFLPDKDFSQHGGSGSPGANPGQGLGGPASGLPPGATGQAFYGAPAAPGPAELSGQNLPAPAALENTGPAGLPPGAEAADLPLSRPLDQMLIVSAHTGQGLSALRGWLAALAPPPGPDPIITSARQAALMAAARDDLLAAAQSAREGMTPDAFLSDAERALGTLGQITGETASPDMAQAIFSRFCVGK